MGENQNAFMEIYATDLLKYTPENFWDFLCLQKLTIYYIKIY